MLLVFFFSSYVFYFLLIGFLLLKLGFVPQKIFKSVLFAGSSISLIPLIIFFSKKSKIPLKWIVKFPGIKIILLMAILSIALKIMTSPLTNVIENGVNMFSGKLKFLYFGVSEFNLNVAIQTISAVMIAPIFEEFFFRKQLLGQLLKRFSPTIAIVFSAVLFAAGHMRLYDIGALFIYGLFFGFVYYKTKSIETSILLHSFVGFISIYYHYEFHAITETKLLDYISMMVASFIIIYLVIKYISHNDKLKMEFQKKNSDDLL